MTPENVHWMITLGALVLIIGVIAVSWSYAATHNGIEDDDPEDVLRSGQEPVSDGTRTRIPRPSAGPERTHG